MLKVVHLTPSFLPVIGGTEYYIFNLSTALKKLGIVTEVISLTDTSRQCTLNFLKSEYINSVKKNVWPSKYIGLLRIPFRVHYLPLHLNKLKEYVSLFDIIHFHDDVDLTFPLFTRKVKRPKVLSCHSLSYWIKYYRYNPLARRILINSSNMFHVFSKRDKNFLITLGIPEDNVVIIPHGVNIEEFKPNPKKSYKSHVNIGFLGRICKKKGVLYLLRGIYILLKEFKITMPIKVYIAGPINDIKYFNTLREYVYRKNLQDFVTFCGPVHPPSFLQKLDIFVYPSLEEVFGLVVLEAMASGLPVIVSNIVPLNEIVMHGRCGFIVPPKSPEHIAQKLYLLISDPTLCKRMGRESREIVKAKYSLERHVEKLIKNVYEVLLR
ncbi:hypothetical protein DRJ17_05155 [Candidatus Woesearchaeota archaeon]|nr:MAG: hypothetical protein DRJ17_05155 [Candidatus Woesearchaeota archaeon]